MADILNRILAVAIKQKQSLEEANAGGLAELVTQRAELFGFLTAFVPVLREEAPTFTSEERNELRSLAARILQIDQELAILGEAMLVRKRSELETVRRGRTSLRYLRQRRQSRASSSIDFSL